MYANRHEDRQLGFGQLGFTLIEPLVVIAIIGILTAIAVPMFPGRREKAKTAALVSNARANAAPATPLRVSIPPPQRPAPSSSSSSEAAP